MALRFKPRFEWMLGGMLLVAVVLRLAYVAAQAGTDPWFVEPSGGDPADTLNWARELLAGAAAREGAFYGPPLYPYLLSGFLRIFGLNFGLLYYLQHILTVAAGGLLALAGRRVLGDRVGLAACGLFLLYGPNLFFASRPVAEPLGIFLLCLALYGFTRASQWSAGVTGWVAGLASVARPTLLPLAPLWALGRARRHPRCAALLLLGWVLALAPTTIRNYAASGHVVPVAANAGLTFYHGNGPRATGYIRVPPELNQAGKGDQRRIATWIARERTGQLLDEVQADRWWGREALRERLRHPFDSAKLLLWRAWLVLWNSELALDMGPRQDANPLRWGAPLPLVAIVALAAAGVAMVGWRGSGGWPFWGSVLVCAAAPLAFYVCSRYRLPMVAMLCLPAAAGLVALWHPPAGARPRWIGCSVALVVGAASLLVPGDDLLAQSDAGGLRQRARAWRQVGRLAEAEADLRRSLALLEGVSPTWVQLGDLYEQTGRTREAESSYRTALALQPGYAPAACALGQLMRLQGREAEAVPLLRRAVGAHAFLEPCWNHLVGALIALDKWDEAGTEAGRAAQHGVEVDDRLLLALDGRGAPETDEDRSDRDGPTAE